MCNRNVVRQQLLVKIIKLILNFNEVTDFKSLRRLKTLQQLNLVETPVKGVFSVLGVIDALQFQNLTNSEKVGLRGIFKEVYGDDESKYFKNPELIMPSIGRNAHLIAALGVLRPSLYIQPLMLGGENKNSIFDFESGALFRLANTFR
ncbi:hypothetical protein DASC09_040660 [Saccharomycopsis crataegensis]|uniref:Uncharacterized protein n=1 Tax=Saccharomycopsis crataegensis TaxID=43959 RepID=A0AAV5QQB7_9ASCO|nr:hypothetical protein DASC09_040660 [Saccharomycopsis crataegensis]